MFFFGSCLEVAIDVLDHDNRGVDDDTEIDGADGQQVCVFAAQDENDDAEEQCERDVGTHDDGAAEVTEEEPLDQENQQTAEQEVVHDRAGGDGDERAAVIERDQFQAGGKTAVSVDLFDLRADARDNVIRVQCAV